MISNASKMQYTSAIMLLGALAHSSVNAQEDPINTLPIEPVGPSLTTEAPIATTTAPTTEAPTTAPTTGEPVDPSNGSVDNLTTDEPSSTGDEDSSDSDDSGPYGPLAYDNNNYGQCPEPTPIVEEPTKSYVSVCGDATFKVDVTEDDKPCAGNTDSAPSGTLCPKAGHESTKHCRPEIYSYIVGGNSGTCVAPEDATCEKLISGAWGCVFPGNCNTINECLIKQVVNENYKKNDKDETIVGENGYCEPTETYKDKVTYDTTTYEPLKKYEPDTNVPNNCELAYDTENVCKCQTPVPSIEYPDKIEVSVCGDATFLLDTDVKLCSGSTDSEAAGTACPKKGDETTLACRENVLSYLTGGSSGNCIAPEDATCEKLNTGAWGCLFPGNANTVNTCVNEITPTPNYQLDPDGKVMLAENGYPMLTDEAKANGANDTSNYAKLSKFSDGKQETSGASMAAQVTMTTMTLLSIVALATL